MEGKSLTCVAGEGICVVDVVQGTGRRMGSVVSHVSD